MWSCGPAQIGPRKSPTKLYHHLYQRILFEQCQCASSVSPPIIMGHQNHLIHILTTIEMIWSNVAMRANSTWTSLTTYEDVSSSLSPQSVWAVPMCFFGVTAKYNGPPKSSHAHICAKNDNMAECGAAGQLKLVLSYHLRSCNIISINAIRLSSVNMLLRCRRQV